MFSVVKNLVKAGAIPKHYSKPGEVSEKSRKTSINASHMGLLKKKPENRKSSKKVKPNFLRPEHAFD
jgi:hypothetical protein